MRGQGIRFRVGNRAWLVFEVRYLVLTALGHPLAEWPWHRQKCHRSSSQNLG